MAYTRRHWVNYPRTDTPVDADALNNIEDGIEESHNIQLLAVTDTAPSECAEGDKYYDTTTNLIYTATGTDEWGETGETPIADILYIVLDEQSTYTYDGTDLVSVGGGNGGETLPVGSEIDYDGTTVPTGWEEMTDYDTGWIEITQSDLAQGTAGTGYYVPAYRRIGNVVYLKGYVNNVTARASAIFTLPSGFYDTANRRSFCATNDNLEIVYLRLTNAGVVQIQQSTGNFTSGVTAIFDGICFTVD